MQEQKLRGKGTRHGRLETHLLAAGKIPKSVKNEYSSASLRSRVIPSSKHLEDAHEYAAPMDANL